jgi:hypothetical protein
MLNVRTAHLFYSEQEVFSDISIIMKIDQNALAYQILENMNQSGVRV